MSYRQVSAAILFSVGTFASPVLAEETVTHFSRPAMTELGFPFSEAVQHGKTLYLSGVIGTKPGKAEVVDGGIEAETKAAMNIIGEVLAAHQLSYKDLVKCTVFLADMAEWPTFNDVYATYFDGGPFPARSAFGVNGLALNARLEIECVAAVP